MTSSRTRRDFFGWSRNLLAAVARAAKNPVRLIELQIKAGEYLAKRLRCEAAMVTAGAASALTLGTSACLIVMNKCAPHDVPMGVAGLKNEVIVQKEEALKK